MFPSAPWLLQLPRQRLSIRRLDGEVLLLEVSSDSTLRDLKDRLREVQLREAQFATDEVTVSLTTVELLLQGEVLQDNKATVAELGLSEEQDLQVLYSLQTVECASQEESGCEKEDLRVVVVPEGVLAVGLCAFQGCSALVSVRLPQALTFVGDSAFQDCLSLAKMALPMSVSYLGTDAFRNCRSLVSVTLPESLTRLREGVFANCRSLTSVLIPDSITTIEKAVFRGCSALRSVTLPSLVSSIGICAFQSCSCLDQMTIPESVTFMGAGAFQNCSGLVSVTLPNSLTSINFSTFKDCHSLATINIPDSVVAIGHKAFENCRSLVMLTLPNSIVSVGAGAFAGCALEKVSLPDSVKHLERGAFENCGALTQVQVPQTLSCSTWTPRRPSAMKTAIRVLVLVSSADTRRAMMLAIDTAVLGAEPVGCGPMAQMDPYWILSLECIDVDVNTGRHSPLFAWLVSSSFLACTGDSALVVMMLVTTFFMCIITYSFNTPERYDYIRVSLLPVRVAVSVGIALQSNQLSQYISVLIFSYLSIFVLVIDFILGDLFLLWAYRFQCSYRVLDILPARVFLCAREGAAHLDDVLGHRIGITTEVIGCAWDSRYSLIADLNGLICELRRPRMEELQALVQDFQENQEDYGFLSVKCFSTDRPNFAALEQDIPLRELNRLIEIHRRQHLWTWRMVSKRDMKFPEKKGAEVLELKKQLLKQTQSE
ncbi:Putative surface protein bspA-like (TvBspA-like-625) [Durusdinium trenchii]|uniref:Surface protein bspA-like (TvBspA-like-625) n=1 Tax=Durusdinium trenchii TaxID=1381693 RepID=A0ABP0NIR9_9DINO